MAYVKHPTLGNKHAPDSDVAALEAAGWVRFPRPKEAKARGAWPPTTNAAPQEAGQQSVSAATVPTPDGAAPVKRGPGRTRKAAA